MMDKNREAFEAWYCLTKGVDKYWVADRRCEPESYTIGENILIYWECWKASRQAIEVELNGDACHSDDYFNDGYRIATEAAEEAITSLGIRVKGNEE